MSNKTKELIICLVTVAILALALTTNVFATDLFDELDDGDFNTIEEMNNTVNNTINNTTNNTINNTTNNRTNNAVNNTAGIPNTGVDYSVVFVIAICGISAIYAYKKIKDYNNF